MKLSTRSRAGLTTASIAIVVCVLALSAVSMTYVASSQGSQDQIARLRTQLQALQSKVDSGLGTQSNISLPIMNQPPSIRTITDTWFLSSSAHQDRFDPSFIVVNQGDTVKLTLIDNDTVAHDWVIGPPYDITVNATVPGLINDLTGQEFTTNATNNSPGVVVKGTPGNVSAEYSFVARFSGIYEFVCTYHAEVGMIGYLVVLPNRGFSSTTTGTSTATSRFNATVNIVQGAGTDLSNRGYTPNSLVVVLGLNSTVVWKNLDSSPHTITADDGSFSSGNLAPGATYSYTFVRAGKFTYHCTYHPWMTATITVKAAP